jgi:hypothetical protein
MSVLQRLKLALGCVFWLFAVLFAYAVGRTTSEFDWPSFWAVLAVSGAAYVLATAISWAWSGLGRVRPRGS